MEITLCPLVYSGNGGVCSNGCQRSSRYLLITVSGRIMLLRYFSSHTLMKPSARPIAVRAYTAADRMISAWTFRAAIGTIPIQCPPGVTFFVANIACPWTCIT